MPICTEVKSLKKIKLKKAPKYCNVFYNNDKTSMEVVVHLLVNVFNMSPQEAEAKTFEIHKKDRGIVFISSKETCDFKSELVNQNMIMLKERHLKQTVELYEEDNS